jgi:hypothetical protein
MTADLNAGTYRLYMDGVLLASLTDILVPPEVYIDFFRLGANVRRGGEFIIYYDDVGASNLDSSPNVNQWSLRITTSVGGSPHPSGKLTLGEGESLTINATPTPGYIFSTWIFDGANYSTNPNITIPPQTTGTQHSLYALFTNTNPQSIPIDIWLPFQALGLALTVSGGYLLWSHKKEAN